MQNVASSDHVLAVLDAAEYFLFKPVSRGVAALLHCI